MPDDVRDFIDITGALADESRVRLLLALRGGERCACQLVEFLDLAGSTVSKHLSILQRAGLVTARKEGRWIYYALPGRTADAVVRGALAWVFRSVGAAPRAEEDVRRLRRILAIAPAELCKRQGRR